MRKQVILKQDFTPLSLPGSDGVVVAQCIRAGNFVFITGQTAFNGDGRLVGAGDARAQAEQACENIKRLLGLAGGTLADVVKIVVYVTDRAHRPVAILPGGVALRHRIHRAGAGAAGAAHRDRRMGIHRRRQDAKEASSNPECRSDESSGQQWRGRSGVSGGQSRVPPGSGRVDARG